MNKVTQAPLETYLPTLEDVRALARACSRRAPTGIRNRSLILVLAATGARISEALDLRPRDYSATENWIRVQRGKGGKQRVVPIGLPEAVEALETWMDRRKALGISDHRPIFCSLKGSRIQTSYVRAALPRIARKAGIAGRIHPHGLRHFFACALAQSQCPIIHVQHALGHTSLAVTAKYLARLSPRDTADAVVAAFGRMLSE